MRNSSEGSIVEVAIEGSVLVNVREIVWVGGTMTSGKPIRLPEGTRLNVLKIWRGENGRVLLQIADYLDPERRKFYNRRRLPEFEAGSWRAVCFEVE